MKHVRAFRHIMLVVFLMFASTNIFPQTAPQQRRRDSRLAAGGWLPPGVVVKGSTLKARHADEYAQMLRVYEEFVRQEMERERIPGMTIGFVKDSYMWVKGFGYADLENKIP